MIHIFHRYDESCTGEIDYNDFVEKVMESDFKTVHVSIKKHLENMISNVFPSTTTKDDWGESELATDETVKVVGKGDDVEDSEDDEWESIMRNEIKKLYDLVDDDKSGFIDRGELEVLLDQLGKKVSSEEITKGFQCLDMDSSGLIDFHEFYTWYKNALASGSVTEA